MTPANATPAPTPAQPAPRVQENPRVVVLVHGPRWTPAYADLLRALAEHDSFDVAGLFGGPGPDGSDTPCPLVPYGLDDVRALGVIPDGEQILLECRDLLFEHARRRLPDYDYYLFVDQDVDVGGDDASVVRRLVAALGEAGTSGVDLVGPELSKVDWPWVHTANAARIFPEVWAVFTPMLLLSHRAVQRLHFFRLEEGPPDLPTAERVNLSALCSLFVGHDAYRAVDLISLVPDAYAYWSFYDGPPMMSGVHSAGANPRRIRHPARFAEAFLEPHLLEARRLGDLRPMLAVLQDPQLPIPARTRARFTARAEAFHAEAPPPSFRAAIRLFDPPAAMLLVDDDDLPVRDRGQAPRSMTEVGGKPLYRHVLERLQASAIREVVVVAGPDSSSVREHLMRDHRSAGIDGEAMEALVHITSQQRIWLPRPENGPSARWRAAFLQINSRPTLIAYGNVWADVDVRDLLGAHVRGGRLMTLAVAQGASVVLGLDEAIRKVAEYRPGLGGLLQEAGMAVAEPGLFADLCRPNALDRDRLLGPLDDPERFTRFTHTGVFHPVNSERDAITAERLFDAYPEMFDVDLDQVRATRGVTRYG